MSDACVLHTQCGTPAAHPFVHSYTMRRRTSKKRRLTPGHPPCRTPAARSSQVLCQRGSAAGPPSQRVGPQRPGPRDRRNHASTEKAYARAFDDQSSRRDLALVVAECTARSAPVTLIIATSSPPDVHPLIVQPPPPASRSLSVLGTTRAAVNRVTTAAFCTYDTFLLSSLSCSHGFEVAELSSPLRPS